MKNWFSLLIVPVVGLLGYFLWQQIHHRGPSLVDESEAEREASVRAAFAPSGDSSGGADVTGDVALKAEVEQFFGELGESLVNEDLAEFERLFSARALLDYMDKCGYLNLDSANPLKRNQLKDQMASGLPQGMLSNAEMMAFAEPRVMRLEQIREGELVAYIRAQSTLFDVATKMRWWLLKNPDGQWQAYDFEDLDVSLRTSTVAGASLGGRNPWIADLQGMIEGIRDTAMEATDESMAKLRRDSEALLKRRVPPEIESMALTIHSTVLLDDGDTEGALADLEKAEKILGGAPVIYYHRGNCYSIEGDYERAIAEYERYTELLGWDADVHEMVSDCHYHLDQLPAALEHAEKGLADNPRSTGCLASLAASLPESRRGELAGQIAKFADQEAAYEAILDYAIDLENRQIFDLVLPQLKAAMPDSWLVEYYEDEELFPTPEAAEVEVD